jgi:hypothetical protein
MLLPVSISSEPFVTIFVLGFNDAHRPSNFKSLVKWMSKCAVRHRPLVELPYRSTPFFFVAVTNPGIC